jgi:hypothetical protein
MIGILHEVLEEDMRNEADRSSIIVLVLAAAVFLLRRGARLKSQYSFICRLGTGKADWAIKCGGKIIMVVEAKAKNLDEGVAQNELQMIAAHLKNTNNVPTAGTMYGVVSTADKWLILRTEFAEDGSHKVTRSNVSPITLPLEGASLNAQELHNQFKWLMENMMWPLHEQTGAEQSQQGSAEQPAQGQSQQDPTVQLSQEQPQQNLYEPVEREQFRNVSHQKRRRVNL